MKSFKYFLFESHYKLKGLIDFDGINDSKYIKKYSNQKGEMKHNYKNGKPCTGIKIEGDYELIPALIRETKKGYYSLLYDDVSIFVIFNKKMFELSRKSYKNDPVYDEMVSFGKKMDIEKFYFDELEDTLW
jgi:hypothetical protein